MEKWMARRGEVQLDGRGKAVFMSGLLIDITAQTEAETALRTSENLYRAIGSSIHYGVRVAIGTERILTRANLFCSNAMVGDLKSVLLGNVLSQRSRDTLTLGMETNLTGLDRLRAKLPASWRVADKTGANGEHTSNDIAVIWPAGKLPIIVAAYITQCTGPESKRAAMLAENGKLVKQSLG